MREVEKILEYFQKKGLRRYFTADDLMGLFLLGGKVPKNGCILEIGSGTGCSMVTFGVASGAPERNIRLVSIDSFEPYLDEYPDGLKEGWTGDYELFKQNISAFGLKVESILKRSSEAVSDIEEGSVDLLFIDGCHTCSVVRGDILGYTGKVKANGTLCGHDYWPVHPGVVKAVDEIFGKEGIRVVGTSVWVVRR